MPEPIPLRVLRYRCPFCARTASRPIRSRQHMARCWLNPEARGCKTCKHFDRYGAYETYGDECLLGVDLSGRPECEACRGTGFAAATQAGLFDSGEVCSVCNGEPAPIKSGPIVGCEKWEPQGGTPNA